MTDLNDNIETVEEAQFRLEERKWLHRRGIAKKSFYALLFIVFSSFALLLLGNDSIIDRIEKFEDLLIACVLGFTSIVGFYFGATTWADTKR